MGKKTKKADKMQTVKQVLYTTMAVGLTFVMAAIATVKRDDFTLSNPSYIQQLFGKNTKYSHDDESISVNRKSYTKYKTIDAIVTAYSPDVEGLGKGGKQVADGYTSIMQDAYFLDGVAGVQNPKKSVHGYGYGDAVFIEGIGLKEIDDCGSGMSRSFKKGKYHFDLRFRTADEAREHGVKNLKVTIYHKK